MKKIVDFCTFVHYPVEACTLAAITLTGNLCQTGVLLYRLDR